jgi:hypothetical protein
MGTQWIWAEGQATGLNYAALPGVWEFTGIAKKDRDEAFHALRVMEQAAIKQMAADAKEAMERAKRK